MRIVFINFCLIYLFFAAQGQQVPDLYFHQIKDIHGLSYNIINCFLKDSRGLLWIGTYNGLNRYDGAHFRVYKKDSTAQSLPDNTVHELIEDRLGNIWGATEAGIFRLDRHTNRFKTYRVAPSRQVVWNILKDSQGTIWAAHAFGIVRYHAEADSFRPMALATASANLFNRIFVRKNGLEASPDGSGIWAATAEGLLYYNPALASLTCAKNHPDTMLYAPGSVSALCATRFGHYWYYDNTRQALVQFDPLNRKVNLRIQPKAFAKLGGVTTVFEDNNHLVWLCTWNYEIFTIDYLHGNIIRRVQHNDRERQSIAGDFFWTAMHESNGTLWLGTVGGISRHNTQRAFYKVHHFPQNLMAAAGASVSFLAEHASDSTWWIGSTNNLLLQYHPQTQAITTYDLNKFPANKYGKVPLGVNSLIEKDGRLYLFNRNGIWVREPKQRSFTPLQINGLPDSVVINQAVSGKDDNLWLCGPNSLWQWNTRHGNIKHFPTMPGATQVPKQYQLDFLTMGPNQKPWMVIADDCFAYADDEHLIPLRAATRSVSDNVGYYTAMIADAKGRLWAVRKGEGLYCFNPATKAYRLYAQYNGLVMDHIIDATADSTGRIWTAAYNQLSVFTPETNSFYNISLPLSEDRYRYENSMMTLHNGNVVSSVADKLVEFFPDRVKPYSVFERPIISALTAGGKEIPLPDSGAVKLRPHENDVVLKFGLIEDQEDSPFFIEYLLEGATRRWTTASDNFEAVYNQLTPGKYVFRVRAVAKDNSWKTEEAILRLHLAAPFYRSLWFLTLMAGLVLAAVYTFYTYRMRQHQQVLSLEHKAQQLEREKTAVMFENLKQQLNPHFLFNSLTSLSGLIESDQEMAEEFLNQMSGIYRYILKHADSEKVTLKEEIDFVRLYINLQQTRFDEGLQVRMNVPDEYKHNKIAPVTLQNLIDNAIKHNITDVGSPLQIDVFIEGDYLVVENNLQRKSIVETSNKKGLVQFVSLYRYLSSLPVLIEESDTKFRISVPLL